MKIVVTCGGTGGHAFPGLAVATELRRQGHEVTVWDSGRSIESSVMKAWDGPMFSTWARPLRLRNALALVRSILRCRAQLRRQRPDALLAMGSYSSLPPVLAAKAAGVPVVLHEANTVPGRAVEFLSRFACKVAVAFEETAKYLPGVAVERVGLPVRAGIDAGRRFDFIPPDAFVVFVTGGSQGAHAVNQVASRALVQFDRDLRRRNEKRRLYVIHQTGFKDEGELLAVYAAAGIPARVHAFENRMADAFASADLVIARAGASTCFELAACGKSAFFLPLPTALRNHQQRNADVFVRAGAADAGVQAKLSPLQLAKLLLDRFEHPERLAETGRRMRAFATPDAAAKTAALVLQAAGARD